MATNILVQEAYRIPPASLSSICSVFRLHPPPLDEFSLIRAYLSIQKYPLKLLLFHVNSYFFLLFSYYFISEPPTFFLLFHQGRVESLIIHKIKLDQWLNGYRFCCVVVNSILTMGTSFHFEILVCFEFLATCLS